MAAAAARAIAAFLASDAAKPVLAVGAVVTEAAGLATAVDAEGAGVVATFAVVAVEVAGAAVLAALEALALGAGVAATTDADVFGVGAGGGTAATDVAGAALALGAAVPAALAAARAAATAALALAIAAAASFEMGAPAAGTAVSSTFFLQAEKEPSAITAHIASEKRDPICILRPWLLG